MNRSVLGWSAGSVLLLVVVLGAGCRPTGAPQTASAAPESASPGQKPAAPVPPPPAPAPAPRTNAAAAAAPDDDGPSYHLDRALSGLAKFKLLIGTHDLDAEVCVTLPQVATGLMHRKGIGPEEAMLFVFGTPQRRAFYMKNVTFPIAAAYIDAEGVIQEVVQLKAMDRTPVPSKSEAIQFVLETAPDWFERNGVGVGTQVVTDRGSLVDKLGPFAQLK